MATQPVTGAGRIDDAQPHLGKKHLTTLHAIGQALAIGPIFTRRARQRPGRERGRLLHPGVDRARLDRLDRARVRDRDLRPAICRRRRHLRVPGAGGAQLVRDLLRLGIPARHAVPRRRRHLHRSRVPGPGVLPEPHPHLDPVVGRWRRRARDRVHPQSPRRQARDPGRPPPGLDLGDPVAVPVGRDHRQGRRRRQHARGVQPERDLVERRVQRDSVRGDALHRVRGGGLDRRGDREPAQVDSDRGRRRGRAERGACTSSSVTRRRSGSARWRWRRARGSRPRVRWARSPPSTWATG